MSRQKTLWLVRNELASSIAAMVIISGDRRASGPRSQPRQMAVSSPEGLASRGRLLLPFSLAIVLATALSDTVRRLGSGLLNMGLAPIHFPRIEAASRDKHLGMKWRTARKNTWKNQFLQNAEASSVLNTRQGRYYAPTPSSTIIFPQ